MGLLSIFKRQADSSRNSPTSVADATDAVLHARTRARQRLVGAAVLLVIGIVGFPLVFETQPRPIPVNISIEAPSKDSALPLTMPPARAPAASSIAAAAGALAVAPTSAAPKAATAAPSEVTTESNEDAGREVAAPPSAPAPAASRPAVATPAPKPTAQRKPAATPADGVRALALLEGQPDKSAETGRFVVQVGAFTDASAAHETRLRVEKLGLKTYTQVASTAAGNRIRVRVGPFASRGEADKALAKAKGAGLTAVVLTL
jgi:DedD protein